MKSYIYENFSKIVERLDKSNAVYKIDPTNGFYRDSVIRRFEFSFELAWKTLREYMTEQGYSLTAVSPKGVISTAYQEGIIQNEKLWLEMLESRNLSSHDYGNELAATLAETFPKDM